MDLIEITEERVLVLEDGGPAVVIEDLLLEIIAESAQGPPGPAGTASFDLDLVLLYQIAKL